MARSSSERCLVNVDDFITWDNDDHESGGNSCRNIDEGGGGGGSSSSMSTSSPSRPNQSATANDASNDASSDDAHDASHGRTAYRDSNETPIAAPPPSSPRHLGTGVESRADLPPDRNPAPPNHNVVMGRSSHHDNFYKQIHDVMIGDNLVVRTDVPYWLESSTAPRWTTLMESPTPDDAKHPHQPVLVDALVVENIESSHEHRSLAPLMTLPIQSIGVPSFIAPLPLSPSAPNVIAPPSSTARQKANQRTLTRRIATVALVLFIVAIVAILVVFLLLWRLAWQPQNSEQSSASDTVRSAVTTNAPLALPLGAPLAVPIPAPSVTNTSDSPSLAPLSTWSAMPTSLVQASQSATPTSAAPFRSTPGPVAVVTSQAVTGGPYLAVDLNGDGWENVPVNASQSTAAGSSTIDFAAWMVGDEVLGTGLVTSLRLPVGDTNVTLTLVDSTGSSFSDETVIRVEASEAPPPTALSAPAPNTSNTETTGRNAILINCGGAPNYTDTAGRLWLSDIYFDGRSESMESPDLGIDIANTEDDVLYQSYRQGYSSSNFTYSIPVPSGMYTIILHFSEPLWSQAESRVFTVVFDDDKQHSKHIVGLDVFRRAGGKDTAMTRTVELLEVRDGSLSLTFMAIIDSPIVAAIEVFPQGYDTLSITGGPYLAVDWNGDGWESVPVDASQAQASRSNTIISAIWMVDATIVGMGLMTTLWLPVGDTTVTLTLEDTLGSSFSGATTIRVNATPSASPVSAPPTTLALPASSGTSTLETKGRNAMLINCGWTQNYTDSTGRVWLSDRYFDDSSDFGGQSTEFPDFSIDIANTVDDLLYQTYRQSFYSINLTYSIPVPSGMYSVILHFSEPLMWQAESRVFTIVFDDDKQHSKNIVGLDVFRQAGGKDTAMTRTVELLEVLDGFLSLTFLAIIDSPIVAAIEVLPQE